MSLLSLLPENLAVQQLSTVLVAATCVMARNVATPSTAIFAHQSGTRQQRAGDRAGIRIGVFEPVWWAYVVAISSRAAAWALLGPETVEMRGGKGSWAI